MKTKLIALALIATCALAIPQNPTAPTPVQLAAPQFSGPAVIVYVPGGPGYRAAKLDPSVVLDTSGSTPVLKAVVAAVRQVIGEAYDVTATTTTTITLVNPPIVGTLQAYRNGIRLRPGPDYTLAGAVVTFAGGQAAPQTGDALVFDYQF